MSLELVTKTSIGKTQFRLVCTDNNIIEGEHANVFFMCPSGDGKFFITSPDDAEFIGTVLDALDEIAAMKGVDAVMRLRTLRAQAARR